MSKSVSEQKRLLTLKEKETVEDYLEYIEELYNPSYKANAYFLAKLIKRQHQVIRLLFEERGALEAEITNLELDVINCYPDSVFAQHFKKQLEEKRTQVE